MNRLASEYHERAAIGCVLKGARDRRLRPDLFVHVGRQVLCMGLLSLAECRSMVADHLQNEARLCWIVEETGAWPIAGTVEHEVFECSLACTEPLHLDWHIDQLQELRVRRVVRAASQRAAMAAERDWDLREVEEWLMMAHKGVEWLLRRSGQELSIEAKPDEAKASTSPMAASGQAVA